MPGPVIANPIPFKYRPGTESVLDDFWTRVLRRIGTITGANDPQQIMSVAGAMGIPGGEASPAAKAVQAGAQYLESKFPKLASYIKAYHGSPHDFDKFSLDKIGTGEGAQAYGHGLYFAERPETAQSYKKLNNASMLAATLPDGREINPMGRGPVHSALQMVYDAGGNVDKAVTEARRLSMRAPVIEALEGLKRDGAVLNTNPGRMYEVSINAHPDAFLDWDKPLSQQSPAIQEKLKPIIEDMLSRPLQPKALDKLRNGTATGHDLYFWYSGEKMIDDAKVTWPAPVQSPSKLGTEGMRQAGIPGIKYLDQGSRATGEGTRNFVVFDDSLIDIMRKYGVVLPLGAGLAALSQQQQKAAK